MEVSAGSTRMLSPQLRTPNGEDDMLDSLIDIDHEYILDDMTRIEKQQIGYSREKILNLSLQDVLFFVLDVLLRLTVNISKGSKVLWDFRKNKSMIILRFGTDESFPNQARAYYRQWTERCQLQRLCWVLVTLAFSMLCHVKGMIHQKFNLLNTRVFKIHNTLVKHQYKNVWYENPYQWYQDCCQVFSI